MLEPGASQTMTLTFSIEDMASYDYQNAQAYVLEAGDYVISLRSDSHNVIDSRIYNVADTITYSGDNARSTDLTTAANQFDFAEGDIEYLSRADGFANFDEVTAAPAMNIHRSAFAGRNFEYYSEDGLLSGKIASQAVQGAAEHGVYAYIVIAVLIVPYEALRVRKVYGKRKAAGKGTAQE